ncbi:DUF4817 domain-containing protein [Trichonephila clavipes]|nr:DUF4817 domain-containing protein [Trichonephila clavipes]
MNIFPRAKNSYRRILFRYKISLPVINAFQQKYPGETAPNASTRTRIVQRFRDTGPVAHRKQSSRANGTASIVKTKVTDVETALQMKRPSVHINIIMQFTSLLKSDERYLSCSKTEQRVTHHGILNCNFR